MNIEIRSSSLDADRYLIEQFTANPKFFHVFADNNFGEFRPDRKGKFSVQGLYLNNVALQGNESLQDQWIGVRDAKSDKVVHACQLMVSAKGYHDRDQNWMTQPTVNPRELYSPLL